MRQRRARPRFEPLAQRFRDGVTGAIADLQEPLPARASTACETIAAVRARELDTAFLEPVDRGRCLRGEDLDETRVRGLVRALHHVASVDLGRVVLSERCLDAALGLRGVARLERRLRREGYTCARSFGRDGRGEARGAAADDEHVVGLAGGHEPMVARSLISVIINRYFLGRLASARISG